MKNNKTTLVTPCIVLVYILLRAREEINVQFAFAQFKKYY